TDSPSKSSSEMVSESSVDDSPEKDCKVLRSASSYDISCCPAGVRNSKVDPEATAFWALSESWAHETKTTLAAAIITAGAKRLEANMKRLSRRIWCWDFRCFVQAKNRKYQ